MKARRLLKDALGVTGTLGVVTGAVSAFNIAVSTWQIGLSDFWTRVLNYWHALFHDTLLASVLRVLPFHVPAWIHEPIILWMVLAGLCVRTVAQARKLSQHANSDSEIGAVETWLFGLSNWLFVVVTLLSCLLLLPLVLVRLLVSKPLWIGTSILMSVRFAHTDGINGQSYSYRSIICIQALLLVVVFLIMFATNAGLSGENTA